MIEGFVRHFPEANAGDNASNNIAAFGSTLRDLLDRMPMRAAGVSRYLVHVLESSSPT